MKYIIAAKKEDFPPCDGRACEVALFGKSNVGKSSLINHFAKSACAKTSSTPGKTKALFFYPVDEKCTFVDLPGYGYASVSQELKQLWQTLTEAYIKLRNPLCLLLIDLRRIPSEEDVNCLLWIQSYGHRLSVVFTKSDKVAKREREKLLAERVAFLKAAIDADIDFVDYSIDEGSSRQKLKRLLKL